MSDEQVIVIDSSFFIGLSASQKNTFEKLIQQNNFLRESIISVEESATDRVATLNAELEDADNSIDKLEVQIATLRVEICRLQVQNDELLEVVDTATQSAKLAMLHEGQVSKDAESMILSEMNSIDSRVGQAEFNIEQKYTNLLYELQDEKDAVQKRLREVEAELASTLVVVETKKKRNTSLTKQVEHLEEAKAELEDEIEGLKKEVNSGSIAKLTAEVNVAREQNAELKDALARIKWRSKEEIDNANNDVFDLKRALANMEKEKQLLRAELARLADEDQKRNNGEISDLDSMCGSVDPPSSPAPRSRSVTPSLKNFTAPSPRLRPSDRSAVSVDGDNQSPMMTISVDDHKAKLAEKQMALDDIKRKHFLLMEELESLRLLHTELIENNMLERRNREKLLKAAQKETTTIQKQYKQCQRTAAAVEKELTDYLVYHKRQSEIKDSTIEVHNELAKSRVANADLAQQLVDAYNTETLCKKMNAELQDEVSLLQAEVTNLYNQMDKIEARYSLSRGAADDDSDDSDDTYASGNEEVDDDDGNHNAVFGNSFQNSVNSPRTSTGTVKQANKKNSHLKASPSGTSPLSPANYDLLKQMYLATALDSVEKQRRDSLASSVFSGSRTNKTPQLKMRPPRIASPNPVVNLNQHMVQSPTKRFSN